MSSRMLRPLSLIGRRNGDTPPPLDEYEIDPRSDVKKLPGGNEKHVYYDRVAQTSLSIGQWSRSKWALLGMNTMATWENAVTMVTTDRNLLIIITTASLATLLCACFGFYATLSERRALLAWWCVLLWVCLGLITSVGYYAYKRQLWNLRAKLGHQWKEFGDNERLTIQDNLNCCGFQGPLDHAAESAKCYTRSLLPGCLGKLYRFTHKSLTASFTAAFTIIPLHVAGIFISLLCANHVNPNFGRRPRPSGY
ncbi:MAG: hypothetical protein DHS80DRAFT_30605 [Piptocephalis tieghemiana]|nr:MAG: hypothetical protein DHS80DRAFT_30605 [Piptocephalis tieghemiana]